MKDLEERNCGRGRQADGDGRNERGKENRERWQQMEGEERERGS